MRSAGGIGIVGHRRRGEIEFGGALGSSIITGGSQEDRAFARAEPGFTGIGAAGIVVGLVFLQVDQVLQMLEVQRRVELQLGVKTIEPVRLGADRHVVPG